MDEYQEFYSLHLAHLISYVVPVLQFKNERLEVGSGVLVNAGGRHFIATAKRCIDGKVRAIRSTAPLQQSGVTGTRELRIIRFGRHATLDLGYLEIVDPRCAELQWDQLCNDRIVGGMAQFVGYPEVLTQATETKPGVLTDISLCAGTFGTSLIEESDVCMTFDYPKIGSKYDERAGAWNGSPFPTTPRGFSGGACFGVAKLSSGGITRVEYKLLGIQYAWVELRRCVRAIPIKQWCELVIEHRLVNL